MDPSKVGLGAALLAASAATLEATGRPGAGLPLALAVLAATVLAGYALGRRGRRSSGR